MATNQVRRIFVEKKAEFRVEANEILADLKENLNIAGLTSVRVLNRYDVTGIIKEEFDKAVNTVFSEPPLDIVYEEKIQIDPEDKSFAIEYLPGQYDQRADSAEQCIEILTQKDRPIIHTAKVIILKGNITDGDFEKIKKYLINPIEAREASFLKPSSLEITVEYPKDVATLAGFNQMNPDLLKKFLEEQSLAMSYEDLVFCQEYFKNTEKRDPTITEIKVIDTYWSDHCRHTTFLTEITETIIETGKYAATLKKAYKEYQLSRKYVYQDKQKPVCLMDIATMAMKDLKKQGLLDDLDESDEINACSLKITVDRDGKEENWLVMFKNETHNHPTEIEPFGGAATCLGGCIRDPLSGRSYVYQAMRVTGSGDPRDLVETTLPGKLPQRKITIGAAKGYSSYGNQIGLATGQVTEIYDQDFIAKRMEIGAVMAAAPKENVVRSTPAAGDVVILVGGRTGRDGCGGATGSSKEHTEKSLYDCEAEVQKGNPVTERKIQRLFRDHNVSSIIKRCNDFGAGGVSVAIGELTEGIVINLDVIPKKYEGLNGTELAISESQERMAVVVPKDKAADFINYAALENLEATIVATVTGDRRLKMLWREKPIVNLSRDFLDTNGVKQYTKVTAAAPSEEDSHSAFYPESLKQLCENSSIDNDSINSNPVLKKIWLDNLADLNICSQKGLVEMFDSSIGKGSVLMPFGGKYQDTPCEGMAAKIPVLTGDTNTGTIMTFGYNANIFKWSPFHGAVYSIVEAAAKVVALGGDYRKIRLTLQEYFEKLGQNSHKWGKPFSALLGAYHAQKQLGIPAIGGKDSMSGTFKDLNVPPVLAAFAVAVFDIRNAVSQEFKKAGSQVVVVAVPKDAEQFPDFNILKRNFEKVQELIKAGQVLAVHTVKYGGISAALSKMCFGNRIGFEFTCFDKNFSLYSDLFAADYGAFILEIPVKENLAAIFGNTSYTLLGKTTVEPVLKINDFTVITLEEAVQAWQQPLEKVFPTMPKDFNFKEDKPLNFSYDRRNTTRSRVKIARPRVFIPVFPGTNCEYDSALTFEKAGALTDTLVIKNFSKEYIKESIQQMVEKINNSQIIMLAGGFSAGDEPDGAGKFIAVMLRNPFIKEAITEFLNKRDGLMLGICNGFQALIKLGLVPYGQIVEMSDDSPTLTYNKIGRHISCMVNTKVTSTLSPWFSQLNLGEVFTISASHGEGRFYSPPAKVDELAANGQIAAQYVDFDGNATYDPKHNPNGSFMAIEAITSPDGRILGKMAHSERAGSYVAVNIPGNKFQRIFSSGVGYFG